MVQVHPRALIVISQFNKGVIMQPYIGITGFMTNQEVISILSDSKQLPQKLTALAAANRKIMIGVLASFKTLNGIPNKWPNRYPPVDKIAEIFTDDPRALNLIHYHTTEHKNLINQLTQVTKLGGPHLHGLQLNVTWPDAQVLKFYKNKHPDKKIVLQINVSKLSYKSQLDWREKIFPRYQECVDYLLLDASGGMGHSLDTELLYAFINNYLFEQAGRYDICLGVAGGLEANTITNLRTLIKAFPKISWDAEGRLRDASDHLDLFKAENYLSRSLALFSTSY